MRALSEQLIPPTWIATAGPSDDGEPRYSLKCGLNRRRMLRGVGRRAFGPCIRVPGGVYLMRRNNRMPAAPNRQWLVGGSTTVG